MVARSYREKRRARRSGHRAPGGNGAGGVGGAGGESRLVALGTVTWPVGLGSDTALSVVVGGRYEVRVGDGFQASTLVRLVESLERV